MVEIYVQYEMMSHILPDMKSVKIATIDCPTTRKQAWFSIFEDRFIVVSTKK